MPRIFTAESPEIVHLKQADNELAQLIDKVGDIDLPQNGSYFESLALAVVSQMLSAKVAAVIKQRLYALCSGSITPESISALEDEQIRGIGISFAKIRSIKDLSQKVQSAELSFESCGDMSDEDVIRSLTKVKGIGKWTAEMFLIFSLGRLDVLSLGDVGLQRAANWLYAQADPSETPDCLVRYSGRWSPYRSVASLYLWRAVDDGYVVRVVD
jgi:DNA-3-methyladenine glycosylase II